MKAIIEPSLACCHSQYSWHCVYPRRLTGQLNHDMSHIIILHGTVTKHFIAAVKAVYPLVFMPIHAGFFSQVYSQRRAVSWNYLLWDVVQH